MGRTRRSPAQKAASARALQIARERNRNKSSGSRSHSISDSPSHPPGPHARHGDPGPTPNQTSPDHHNTLRAQDQTKLELTIARERCAAAKRDLHNARRREARLRKKNEELRQRVRTLEPEEEGSRGESAAPATVRVPDGDLKTVPQEDATLPRDR